jgi:hypothetical protein
VKSPISGIPVSIVAGMLISNLVLARPNQHVQRLRTLLAPGLGFSGKKILQAGVVCIGTIDCLFLFWTLLCFVVDY